MHIGQESFNEYSDEELMQRYSQLFRRYEIARRMNMSYSIIYQMELMLTAMDEEKINRLTIPTDDRIMVIDTDEPSSWDTK